jgi:uncharacterized BrkB/YihY/UPF0761 family membrane protein
VDETSESEPTPPSPGRVERLKTRATALKEEGLHRLEVERERRASVRIAYDFYERDRDFAGSLLAGGLTVKLFLWFLPFALTLVGLFGSLAETLDRPPEELAHDSGLTAALAAMVAKAVETSARASFYLVIIGLFLLLWAGYGVVRALRLVSRLAWRMPSAGRMNPLLASLAVSGVLAAVLAMNRVVNLLLAGSFATDVVVILLFALALAALLTFVFDRLPHPPGTPWQVMIPGALLVTAGVLVTRLITIVYFAPRLETAGDLYGGLGMAAVFLAWLYIVARILVAAIALNATLYFGPPPAGSKPSDPSG